MAIDELSEVDVLTLDEIVAAFKRDYLNMSPDADTGPNTLPHIEANAFAPQQMVIMANAVTIGRGRVLRGNSGTRLDEIGESEGVERPGASESAGFVTITAAAGGTTILAGDELTEPNTSLRFECTKTALYLNGKQVPIASIDTGPLTNLAGETKLRWTNPRSGCADECTVYTDSLGRGLIGGRDIATDDEYYTVIEQNRKNRPAAGNDADYQDAVRDTPEMRVQSVFTIPAVDGPGTIAVSFTLQPEESGDSRIPNAAQMTAVEANLKATFPADDGIFLSDIIAQPEEIAVEIDWSPDAAGWTDYTTWPVQIPADPVRVSGAVARTATSFRLTTATATTTPQVGQTIAFYDADDHAFVRKRILTVTVVLATKQWDITVDTTAAAQSDTSFVPAVGALVSPWSDSLDLLVAPLLAVFDTLGPGEMFSTFPDEGGRQRRSPAATPKTFPNAITNKLITEPLFALDAVEDAELLIPTAVPKATTVGVPMVSVNMITLDDLAFYAPS